MSKASMVPIAVLLAAMPGIADGQTATPHGPGQVDLSSSPPPIFRVSPPPPPAPVASRPGRPLTDPATWFRSKDYPKGARKRGEMGRVFALLQVDQRGRPLSCQIVNHSPFEELDAATCAIAMKRARFSPQLDLTGKPMPFTWPVSMRWTLQE